MALFMILGVANESYVLNVFPTETMTSRFGILHLLLIVTLRLHRLGEGLVPSMPSCQNHQNRRERESNTRQLPHLRDESIVLTIVP